MDPSSITATVSDVTGGNFETVDFSEATALVPTRSTRRRSVFPSADANEDAAGVTFTATLSNPGETDVTIVTNLGDIVIPAGETTGTLFVSTADPDVYMDPSSITATVSGVAGGNFEAVDFSEATATAQISDTIDTTTMSLSGPEYVTEGASATYTVSVDNAPQTDMTVDVTYSYISAETNDIVTHTTQVTLEAGQTSAQFAVDAVNDLIFEETETFEVSISDPQGGNFENLVLGNASVETNIVDSDAPPFFTVNDVTVHEGDGTITFTVTKAGATALASSVDYTVNPNTAVTPGDYTAGTSALTGTLNFAAGVTTQTITLNVTDDAVYELTENFNVNLSNAVNATISDAQGIGTILDDDAKPAFSINDVTVHEGDGTITFTVTKAGATALASSVDYTVNPNTAVTPGITRGRAADGTLNFAAGVTTQTITLNVTERRGIRADGELQRQSEQRG